MRPKGSRLLVAWAFARSASAVDHGSSPGNGTLPLSEPTLLQNAVTSLEDSPGSEIVNEPGFPGVTQSTLSVEDTTSDHSTTPLDSTTSTESHSNSTISTTSSLTSTSTWITSTTTRITTTTTGGPITKTLTGPQDVPSPSMPDCIPWDPITYTSIIVSYTSTITFTGDPADYTPPHEPIFIPSYCEGYEPPPSRTEEPANPLPTSVASSATMVDPENPRPTFSFITTDKNPSVIFEPGSAPGYTFTRTRPGGGGGGPGPEGNTKEKPPETEQRTRTTNMPPPPPPAFTITAGPGDVIIGTSTITGLLPDKTTTVTIGPGTFTIGPTAIIGEGATITKPPPVPSPSAIFPKPTSTNIGGVEVIVTGSHIVADGTTLTVPPGGTTTNINGKPISAGPGRVIVGDETLTMPTGPAAKTDLVVIGGDMLTARDSTVVVLHSTTITYGPGIDETTLVADDDTITVNESGIHVHGSTLGGPDGNQDTTFQVVGGVTITEIGTTALVIRGNTYAIGPDATTITTVIAGETLTIGPGGVTVGGGGMTFTGAGDPTVVTTIVPSGTWLDDMPSQTSTSNRDGSGNGNTSGGGDGSGSGNDDEDEDGASTLIPGFFTVLFTAFGVYVLTGGYV